MNGAPSPPQPLRVPDVRGSLCMSQCWLPCRSGCRVTQEHNSLLCSVLLELSACSFSAGTEISAAHQSCQRSPLAHLAVSTGCARARGTEQCHAPGGALTWLDKTWSGLEVVQYFLGNHTRHSPQQQVTQKCHIAASPTLTSYQHRACPQCSSAV